MHHKLPANPLYASLISLGLVITLIVFVPVIQDYYAFNKLYLLIILAALTMILWVIDVIRHNAITLTFSRGTLGFGAMAAAAAVSVLIASPNKVEGLLSVNGVLLYTSLAVIFLFGSHWYSGRDMTHLRWGVLLSATIAAVIAVYQWLGFGAKVFPTIEYMRDPLWTPLGSPTALITLLILVVPLAVHTLYEGVKHRDEATIAIGAIMSVVIAAGLIVTINQFLPRVNQVFLPYADGWAITLESMKSPKTAIFGVGSENFLSAFTAGRRLSYNATQLWNIRFATNATYVLHIIVTMGLLAGMAFLVLARALIPTKRTLESITLLLGLVILLLVPPSLPTIIVIAILILLVQPTHEMQLSRHIPKAIAWTGPVMALALIAMTATGGYGLARVYGAEMVFHRSLSPSVQTNGTRVYDLQLQATQRNPYIARFAARFARTNLALANAIVAEAQQRAEQEDSDGSITNEERQVVTQLIQQAIREAKRATTLAPQNVTAWENLAATYQALIGVADGSDQWAVAAFQQAMTLDPTNPLIRMNLGGVYVRQQNYSEAITQFTTAAQLKSDLANAYYNLANVLMLSGDYDNAILAMQEAMSYVPENTSDYIKASNELKRLQELSQNPTQPAPPQQPEENIEQEAPSFIENIAPVATTEGNLEPPIELEEGSGINSQE